MPQLVRSGARPDYFDRNPTTFGRAFDSLTGIAPHAYVERWTYTVPTGKKAYLQAVFVMARRVTVAGTPGRFFGGVEIISSNSIGTVYVPVLAYNGNVIDSGGELGMTDIGLLSAGNLVLGFTRDDSTTGTVRWQISGRFVEFDA